MLEPDNLWITVLDMFVFLYIFIEIWTIPLRFAFYEDTEIPFNILPYSDILGYIILAIKMILSTNSGIFHEGTSYYIKIILV